MIAKRTLLRYPVRHNKMSRLVISICFCLLLGATPASSQDNAPPSTSSGSSTSNPPTGSQERASPAPLRLAQICSTKNPPPCATPPTPIFTPDPDYSKEAKQKKIQGEVALRLIVDADGTAQDVKIVRKLRYGLDDEAIKAVKQWKFKPSTMDGVPVPVQINVTVSFRLYRQQPRGLPDAPRR